MLDLNKYSTSKKIPVQARSKETVRQILLASARLFSADGVASITTNDIAEVAGVPIGSVYSYFDDKNAIVASLLELYKTDIITIIDDLADNPLLPRMNRFEVATIIINAWSYYLDNNHPLSYVLFARSEPALQGVVMAQRQRLQASFCRLLHTKSPNRIHDNGPGSSCHLILQQGISLIEDGELIYRDKPKDRQKYLDMSIPAYCSFVENIK